MLASSFLVLSSSFSLSEVKWRQAFSFLDLTINLQQILVTMPRPLLSLNCWNKHFFLLVMLVKWAWRAPVFFSLLGYLTITCDLRASWAKLARAITSKSVLLFLWLQAVSHKHLFIFVRTAAITYLGSVVRTRPMIRHDLACRDIWYTTIVNCPR